MTTYRVVAFDLDGTLVKGKSSWVTLHEYFGTSKKAVLNLRSYEAGKIDYPEFMHRDIALWPHPLHTREIKQILVKRVRYEPEAETLFAELRRRECETAIISAGIDLLANHVGAKLRADEVIANGLQTNELGYLTGQGIFRVDLIRKAALPQLANGLGFTATECIAIGDTKYDKGLLRAAGLGLAYNPDHELANLGFSTIGNLRQVLRYV